MPFYFDNQINDMSIADDLHKKIINTKYIKRHGRIETIQDNVCDVLLYTQRPNAIETNIGQDVVIKKALIQRQYSQTGGLKIPYKVGDDVVVEFFDTNTSEFLKTRSQNVGHASQFNQNFGIVVGHVFSPAVKQEQADTFAYDSTVLFFNQTVIELKDKIKMLNAQSNIKEILESLADAILASNIASKSLQWIVTAPGMPCNLTNPTAYNDSDSKANQAKTKTGQLFE